MGMRNITIKRKYQIEKKNQNYFYFSRYSAYVIINDRFMFSLKYFLDK